MSSCIPAMRWWKTKALARIAPAIRRVCGTSAMPNNRAMLAEMAGRNSASSLRILAARSMPCWSLSAASSTAFWGTDTKRIRSARSETEPCSQPDSGKRLPSWYSTA